MQFSDMTPQDIARTLVTKTFNEHMEQTDNFALTFSDTYVVKYSYILGNWKALVSTTVIDGKYYEITYNSDKNEYYIDTYVKLRNERITVDHFSLWNESMQPVSAQTN